MRDKLVGWLMMFRERQGRKLTQLHTERGIDIQSTQKQRSLEWNVLPLHASVISSPSDKGTMSMWRKGSLSQSYTEVLSTVIVTNTSFYRITIRTSQCPHAWHWLLESPAESITRERCYQHLFLRRISCLTCWTIQRERDAFPPTKKETTAAVDDITTWCCYRQTEGRVGGEETRHTWNHRKREMSWCDFLRGERPWHESGRRTRNLTQLLNPIFHSTPSTVRHCIDKLCSVQEMATNYTQSKRTEGQELIYSRPYRTISCLWKLFICCQLSPLVLEIHEMFLGNSHFLY